MIFDLELFNNLWMLNVFKIKKKMSNYRCNCGKTKKINGNCDGLHSS